MNIEKLPAGYVYNPFSKWPRNLTCFCGSGKKFKNCCEEDFISSGCPANDVHILQKCFDDALKKMKQLDAQGITYRLQGGSVMAKEDAEFRKAVSDDMHLLAARLREEKIKTNILIVSGLLTWAVLIVGAVLLWK